MDYTQRNDNSSIREIIETAERLDTNAQKVLAKNVKLFELKLRAMKLNKSIKTGKKPTINEISSIVRQIRKDTARVKTR
jgi:hypothetical protein